MLLSLFAFGLTEMRAQTPAREYQLKAVFLYNFVQFTEWPTNAFPNTNSPVVIGILGADPFGGTLDETVRGEKVGDRNLVVKRCRRVEEAMDCHVLFISPSEKDPLGVIFWRLKGRNILTVGETENFAENGGMIRFFKEKNKIRFRINVEAVRNASLIISSKLLRLAETASKE